MLLRPTLLGLLLVFFVGAAHAQTCNTAPAPATPAAPMTPAVPAAPVMPAPALNAAGDKSLASGLVAYWRLDDASGTTAVDTANSNNGSLVGTSWTSGKLSGAAAFNGSSSYIDAGDLFYNDAFSVCAWIYPTTVDGNARGIVVKRNSSGTTSGSPEWWLTSGNTGFQFSSWDGVAAVDMTVSSTVIPSTNQWYHVCGVQQGKNNLSIIYVNGSASATANQTNFMANTTSSIQIGAMTFSTPARTFAGSIDEVGIWNRAISAGEVAALYNGGSGNHYGGACGFDY